MLKIFWKNPYMDELKHTIVDTVESIVRKFVYDKAKILQALENEADILDTEIMLAEAKLYEDKQTLKSKRKAIKNLGNAIGDIQKIKVKV